MDQETRSIHESMRDGNRYRDTTKSDRQAVAAELEEIEGKPLRALCPDRPPVSLTKATVFISSKTCDDCAEFKEKVNAFFGLSIRLLAKFGGETDER